MADRVPSAPHTQELLTIDKVVQYVVRTLSVRT